MREPVITINGVTLSEGQAMAVRVACSNFDGWLVGNTLGEDDKELHQNYRERLAEVFKLVLRNQQ